MHRRRHRAAPLVALLAVTVGPGVAWGGSPPDEPPPSFADRLSFALRVSSAALASHDGTEWRVGGEFDVGLPGPAIGPATPRQGWAHRVLVGGGYTRLEGLDGGYARLGWHTGYAFTPRTSLIDTTLLIGVTVAPIFTAVDGGQRLALSFSPGASMRFHVFGLTVASPIQVGLWGRRRLGDAAGRVAGGIEVLVGIWVPGLRW